MQNINTAAYHEKILNRSIFNIGKKTYNIPFGIKSRLSKEFSASKIKESKSKTSSIKKFVRTSIGKSFFSLSSAAVKKISKRKINCEAKDKNVVVLSKEDKKYDSFDELKNDFNNELKAIKEKHLYEEAERQLKVSQMESDLYSKETDAMFERIKKIEPVSLKPIPEPVVTEFTDVFSNSKDPVETSGVGEGVISNDDKALKVKKVKKATVISNRILAGFLATLTLAGVAVSDNNLVSKTTISNPVAIKTSLESDFDNPFVTPIDQYAQTEVEDSQITIGSIVTVDYSTPIYSSASDACNESFKMVSLYPGNQTVICISLLDPSGNIVTCYDEESLQNSLATGCVVSAVGVTAEASNETGITGFYLVGDVNVKTGRSL